MSVKMIVTFGSALDFLLNATRLETEKKKKKKKLANQAGIHPPGGTSYNDLCGGGSARMMYLF